jgi:hypothetical protein
MNPQNSSGEGQCFVCHRVRPLSELLTVSERFGLHRRFYVCRPQLAIGLSCFRAVGSRARYGIALAGAA